MYQVIKRGTLYRISPFYVLEILTIDKKIQSNKKEQPFRIALFRDLGGTRTPTSFTSYAPQTYAYTNSATGPTLHCFGFRLFNAGANIRKNLLYFAYAVHYFHFLLFVVEVFQWKSLIFIYQ
jgi:hypothetical protein